MKIIPENKITTISAYFENENFPSSNMINNSLLKKWKSESKYNPHIKLSVPPNSSAIAFFGVKNIGRLESFVFPAPDYTFYDGVTGYDGVELYQTNIEDPNLNIDFTETDRAFKEIVVTDGFEIYFLIRDSSYPEIGLVSCGPSISFSENPSPGMSNGLIDYSTAKELANGSFYVKTGSVAKSFSGKVVLTKENFNILYNSIINTIKSLPAVWFIMDKNDDYDYLVFARLIDMPVGSVISKNLIDLNFNLIEAI